VLSALAALSLLAAPPPFTRTLALFIRHERVGTVALTFDGARFGYRSQTTVRRGGDFTVERFGAETNGLGVGTNSLGIPLQGPIPSTLALWMFSDGDVNRCLAAEDERTGAFGQVCASRTGHRLVGTLLGERFFATLGADQGPVALELPDQFTRFDAVTESATAAAPLRPRDLFAGTWPAGALASLKRARAATVHGQGPGCQIDEVLDAAAPKADDALTATSPDAWTARARGLGLKTRGRWATARALAAFVSQGIASVGTSPANETARGVWRARRGSCLGQAKLFAALAKALGVPTRVVLGALVEDGAVAAHAWDEVQVGGHWYGVDPSRGQAPAGTSHVPFAREGDADPLRAGRCLLALPAMRWTVQVRR